MKTMRTTVLCLVVLLLAAPSIRAQDFPSIGIFHSEQISSRFVKAYGPEATRRKGYP